MRHFECADCSGRFSSAEARPWCPRCGSQDVVQEETPTGEWTRIIVTMLLILAFFVLFVGPDELEGVAGWFKTGP